MTRIIRYMGILWLACSLMPLQAQIFKKGKPVEDNKGKGEIVKAALPVLTGPKKMVSINEFENKVENQESNWYRDSKLGAGMSDMLATALMDTNYFILLERKELQDAVLKEQDLAASGRTTKQGHAKMGGVLQSQIMIQGAVTMFEEGTKAKAGGGGLSFQGVTVGLGGSGGESQVAVDIRLIDTFTGQVIAAKTCKGFAKSKGRALSLGLSGTSHGHAGSIGFGGEDFQKTPLGDAMRDAISNCVNYIVVEMNKIPWAGKVMKVTPDGKVYINCGSRNNVNVGDTFSVYKVGEKFVDEDTGEDLGAEESLLGTIKISEVKEKLSICSVVSGQGYAKGNVIRWGNQ